MRASQSLAATAAGLLFANNALAIDVDPTDEQSLKDAASAIAANVVSLYGGGQDDGEGKVPGLFPEPYYFWEGGLAWDTLIWYAAVTGDTQYNDAVSKAMAWQVGPDNNYMPPNQTKSLGNDDQSFWGLAAMTAEETGFELPDIDGVDSWLQLAQNVFDSQVSRWDNETCGGGLRWQIFTFNAGYDYKNSLSNANFMQLAARLYAQTQNETYSTWFTTAGSWMLDVGLLDNSTGAVYDGTSVQGRCGQLNTIQWSANTGSVLAAYNTMVGAMSNVPTLALEQLLVQVQNTFSEDDVLTEPACLPRNTCNTDQKAFRAVLARALAGVQGYLSSEEDDAINIDDILTTSAEAAGAQCSGGSDGTACGADWTAESYDGSLGLGEDLSALNIMLANLPQRFQSSNSSGSSSNGTSTSGSGGSSTSSDSASGTSGDGNSSSTPQQQDENMGEQRAASMFSLLGAVGFAVAFFL